MAALSKGQHEVEVERITLRGADDELIDAIHARPDGLPSRGVVLHPDIMGIRPLFDDLCHRLATHGLAVCAPEPFAHLANRDDLNVAARMAAVAELDDAIHLATLARAADYLVVHDDVADIAILGFCMGGMYALKAAAGDRFDRAVAFYGMIRVPEGWRGPNLQEPLDVAADVCPTLAIFGTEDQFTPPADIQALRDAWKDRTDCEIVVYEGAEHGFVHDAERPAHRAADAADAWARTLHFLGVT